MTTLSAARERWHSSWGSAAVTTMLFLIVCLSWGTTWLGIKIAVETVPPITSAGLRFLIAFPLFLSFAWLRGDPILFPKGMSSFFIFVTLFYFCVPYWLLNYGEQYVSSGLTALLFSTMPVFILVLSAFLLEERVLVSQLIGMIVGCMGLALIINSQGQELDYTRFLGVLAILVAAGMHALAYVITKRVGGNIGVVTFNALPIAIAGVFMTAAGVVIEHPQLTAISSRSLLALIYLGLVASVGGFIVYFFLLKRMSPIILSFVFIIFPVFAVVIGAWYEGLPMASDFLLNMAVVLGGFAITKFPIEPLLRKATKGMRHDRAE
ncbi:protein of unknown function DUF6, transmembrane [Rhodopseudomonas palustris BisB18]|uniref:EamA domain-containing protein n=2 Tax=Rhodopseudomonas palustris TaxID=1076 RepID=Q216W1_RHOPB